ncbi:DUF6869 domain-containing protein [Microbulbifer sp. SSSA005]|uniref:DUF6869 domain-containing protein n=1 Tax=Microbulbifer sp. SSSA005 TaxID=3243378 RepID=UPI00403A34D3
MIDENFINQWISHQEETWEEEEAENHWTDDYLIDLAITDGGDSELWDFILKTYRRELSESVLAILAAGPLEDLLARNGESYIEQIEQLARKDSKFKFLLGGVWKNSMSETLWSRVSAVKGEPW